MKSREPLLLLTDLINAGWIASVFAKLWADPAARILTDMTTVALILATIALHVARWLLLRGKPYASLAVNCSTYAGALEQVARLHLGKVPYLISPVPGSQIFASVAQEFEKQNVSLGKAELGDLFQALLRIPALKVVHMCVLGVGIAVLGAGQSRLEFGLISQHVLLMAVATTLLTGLAIYSAAVFVYLSIVSWEG